MPMKFRISSEFGVVEEIRHGRPHNGVDIPLEEGTKLRSIIDGTVERITEGGNLGKGVIIRGEDGNAYIYGHLKRVTCEPGQHVEAGNDIIGLSGNTGHSTGPHLHFGIQAPDHTFIDPAPHVKTLEAVTGNDPLGLYPLGQPVPGGIMDRLNQWGDAMWGKEKEVVHDAAHPVASWFINQLSDLGHWIVTNLPDIMGYGALLAGALIILGSMVGKTQMMKVISIYGGSLIVSFLIRSGGG